MSGSEHVQLAKVLVANRSGSESTINPRLQTDQTSATVYSRAANNIYGKKPYAQRESIYSHFYPILHMQIS